MTHIDLDTLALTSGAHKTRDEGTCIMEAVAWWAGEAHTDGPECASPIVTQFALTLNDGWPDEQRQKLIAFVPRIAGTLDEHDEARGLMAADWLIRTYMPAWLRLANLTAEADTLSVLPALGGWLDLAGCQPALDAARDAARDARDTAWDDAWDADEGATQSAARATASAAVYGTPWAADWFACSDAIQETTWDGSSRQPAEDELRQAALDLLDRMLSVGDA